MFNFEGNVDKDNPAFILKNLLLLDIAVSELVLLERIANYENKSLLDP